MLFVNPEGFENTSRLRYDCRRFEPRRVYYYSRAYVVCKCFKSNSNHKGQLNLSDIVVVLISRSVWASGNFNEYPFLFPKLYPFAYRHFPSLRGSSSEQMLLQRLKISLDFAASIEAAIISFMKFFDMQVYHFFRFTFFQKQIKFWSVSKYCAYLFKKNPAEFQFNVKYCRCRPRRHQ